MMYSFPSRSTSRIASSRMRPSGHHVPLALLAPRSRDPTPVQSLVPSDKLLEVRGLLSLGLVACRPQTPLVDLAPN
jgi:hypothetical protein